MTPLDKTLKRSLTIKAESYVITLSPLSLKLARKGHRLGLELPWASLVSGESALAIALHASVGRFDTDQALKSAAKPTGARPRKSAPGSMSVQATGTAPQARRQKAAPRAVRQKARKSSR